MKRDFYIVTYFAYFASFFFFLMSSVSLWPPYQLFVPYFKYLSIILSLFVLCTSIPKYRGGELLTVLSVGILVLVVGLNCETLLNMFLTYCIIVGAKDIPFRSIVKLHFILAAFFCLFNMFVSEMGWVRKTFSFISTERENYFGNFVERKDYGYGWSTDYALHVFFIFLDFWILQKGKLKFVGLIIYTYVIYFIIVNCDARLAAGGILLIILFTLILKIIANCIQINRKVSMLLVYGVPFFAALIMYVTINYDSTNLYYLGLDLLLSHRLSLGYNAIQDVGIPWFGQVFLMYGAINSGIGDTEYNYLDSSYIQSFVIWGVVLTVVWIYAYIIIAKHAEKRKDYALLSAVFISGIVGIIAQFSCFIPYCVLLCAIFAKHEDLGFVNSSIHLQNNRCRSMGQNDLMPSDDDLEA